MAKKIKGSKNQKNKEIFILNNYFMNTVSLNNTVSLKYNNNSCAPSSRDTKINKKNSSPQEVWSIEKEVG